MKKIIVFALLATILFSPLLFSGNKKQANKYQTAAGMETMKELFKAGCIAPPPHACPNGYCGATMHQNNDQACMCCAPSPGARCKAHASKRTDTIGQ